MILLDNDDESLASSSKLAPSAHPTLRFPEPVAGRSSVSLPDYETSQAQQARARKPSPSFSNRFDSRFWRGTFFALAIYVFLSVVVGIPLIVTRISFRKSRPPSPNISTLFLNDSSGAPPFILPDGNMVMAASKMQCDAWSSMGYSGGFWTATAQHSLSPEGLFSVRSNATDEVPRAGGTNNLTVDINSDASETQVILSITLMASSRQLRSAAHFCFMSGGGGRGYSVYMPQSLASSDYLAFDIRVLFPRSSRSVDDFITYLPMFHQSFGVLSPKLRISNINIAGAGVDIICDSLKADKIAVKTSYASITGTFNVAQSLTLDTIDGPVSANVTLNNDPSTGVATYLIVSTGNGDVVADVTMAGPSKSPHPPRFNGNVQTFNGALNMTISHEAATPPAAVSLQVVNNQAYSWLSLDSKFSGSFDLRTKLAPVQINSLITNASWHLDVDSSSSSSSRGWAGWGTRPSQIDPTMDGQLSVTSSLHPIVLELGR